MLCLRFFFSSRRRHTRCSRDWSSDVCSSDLSGRRLQFPCILHELVIRLPPREGLTGVERYGLDLLIDLARSEEHTSELQSRLHLVCRLLLEKKKKTHRPTRHATIRIPKSASQAAANWR